MPLATTLLSIAKLADASTEMLPLLVEVREAYTDDEWEELEEAQKLSCELQREYTLDRLRRVVSGEPAPGAPDVATLRIQLPSGAKLTRRFPKSAAMQVAMQHT
jgi:hypothetical protein